MICPAVAAGVDIAAAACLLVRFVGVQEGVQCCARTCAMFPRDAYVELWEADRAASRTAQRVCSRRMGVTVRRRHHRQQQQLGGQSEMKLTEGARYSTAGGRKDECFAAALIQVSALGVRLAVIP